MPTIGGNENPHEDKMFFFCFIRSVFKDLITILSFPQFIDKKS